MTYSIITPSFKYRLIKDLELDLSNPQKSVYFYYGRSLPWDDNDTVQELIISNKEENISKSNILALKKITDRDIILATRKISWVSGSEYDVYTDQEDISEKNYYVITNENNVYKCLDNNSQIINGNIVPGKSINKPDHLTDDVIPENDGYVWKYIYTVSAAITRKFLSDNFIPLDINNSTAQSLISMAKPGTINRLEIINSGSQYDLIDYFGNNIIDIPLFIFGNGKENNSGKLQILNITSEGAINIFLSNPIGLSGFEVTNRGLDYTIIQDKWIPVQIRQISSTTSIQSQSTFSYAYGIAKVNQNGQIENLRIADPGLGYTQGEAEIVQSSAIGFARINSTSGEIISTTINPHEGEGFTTAEVIIISDKEDNPDTNGIIIPILSPPLGHRSNPEVELNATNILFNIRIAYEELTGDFSSSNDFRSIGIIENVKSQNANGSTIVNANSLTLSAKTSIVCTEEFDPNDFPGDAILIGTLSGAKAKIVDTINNNTIRVIRDIGTSNFTPFIQGEVVQSSSSSIATISQIIQPEYVPFSGDILFINNKEPIVRSNDQIETINFVLTL